jgi:hypothetical protein
VPAPPAPAAADPEHIAGPPDPRLFNRWGSTAFVAATVLVFAGGIPLIDAYVEFETDAGSPPGPFVRLVPEPPDDSLTASQGVSLAAADGWRPTKADGSAVTLVSGGASLSVRTEPVTSSGECRETQEDAEAALNAHANVTAIASPASLVTEEGVAGAVVSVGSSQTAGLIFVACHDGLAVVATALGPIGPQDALQGVDEMLASVSFR